MFMSRMERFRHVVVNDVDTFGDGACVGGLAQRAESMGFQVGEYIPVSSEERPGKVMLLDRANVVHVGSVGEVWACLNGMDYMCGDWLRDEVSAVWGRE
jgi:hypothetical protein